MFLLSHIQNLSHLKITDTSPPATRVPARLDFGVGRLRRRLRGPRGGDASDSRPLLASDEHAHVICLWESRGGA